MNGEARWGVFSSGKIAREPRSLDPPKIVATVLEVARANGVRLRLGEQVKTSELLERRHLSRLLLDKPHEIRQAQGLPAICELGMLT